MKYYYKQNVVNVIKYSKKEIIRAFFLLTWALRWFRTITLQLPLQTFPELFT